QTSAERPKPVYWFGKDEIISETDKEFVIEKFNKKYHIEKSILKPYFKPTKADEKGMGTYSLLKTDKHIIFPYNADGSLIDIKIMKAEYPGTYQYLLDCYDILVPKCLNGGRGRDIKNATPDTWYQYGRTQALTAFINTPKLIVGVLSKEPMYILDTNDILIASGGTAGYCAVSKKEGSPYALEYLQAWLSNPITEKILEIVGSDFENGFTARGTFVLSTLPFVELDFSDRKQKEIHDSVVAASRRIYSINAELMNHPAKRISIVMQDEKKSLIHKIKGLIEKGYRLSLRTEEQH